MKNTSVESANDQAIEDAASRIYEASRLQPMNVGCNQSQGIILHDRKGAVASPQIENEDDDSDERSAFDGDKSTTGRNTSSDTMACDYSFIEDEDIENDIIYLEEKKRILKKAKIHMEKEKAYTAFSAHHIVNGRELPFRRRRNSSIWSEAKAVMKKIMMRSDSEEVSPTEIVSFNVNDCERRENASSQSTPAIVRHPSTHSSSQPDTNSKTSSRARKRRKIDISKVQHISSTEYAKMCARKKEETALSSDGADDTGGAKRRSPRQHYFSATTRCQQVREMQLSMDSKNWISEVVLQQIFALSYAAIANHRCSMSTKGKGQ